MPQYKYKSIGQDGKVHRGKIQARNTMEVEKRLEDKQHDLITCKAIKPSSFHLGKRKLTRKDLINMVFQLEQLTKSGVPLIEGLKDLRDGTPTGYYNETLSTIVESIEGGQTFSNALAQFPDDFDTVFIALISIGEESGELPKILKDMGNTLRWMDELIAKTVKIMIYPAIVGTVVLMVTVFLMIYLVPDIIGFVNDMGTEIPWYTQSLIVVSNFFVNYWWVLVVLPALIVGSIKFTAKRNKYLRTKLDLCKLKMPIFGETLFKIKLARFASYMALLYSSGITILRSLEICRSLVGNLVIEDAIINVKNNIADGTKISESFSSAELFPPLVTRMVKVGENTGKLDDALLNVSYFFNREVQEAIDKIEPAISPILTVVMGVLLGWIMMSVLGPVWDAVGNIGP